VNTLKGKLTEGRHCLGILDSTCSPEIVEMLCYLGLGFVPLDAEHGTLNLGREGANASPGE
jgi:2-keto-3-deoxy-L-rhamnonate aldolase RhmA